MGKVQEKEKKLKEDVLTLAPESRDIKDLAAKIPTSRNTIYRFFAKFPFYAKQVESLLGRNVLDKEGNPVGIHHNKPNPKRKKREFGSRRKAPKEVLRGKKAQEYKLVTIKVPLHPKETNGRFFSAEDRWQFGVKVCELVEQGVTVANACEGIGLDKATFYRWLNPISTTHIKELKDRYEEAKAVFSQFYDEELLTIGRDSMRRLATDREITLTTKRGTVAEGGKIIVSEVKTQTKVIEPNAHIVKKVMETLHPTFKPQEKGTEEENPYFYREKSDEQLAAEIELTRKKLAELDNGE